MDSDAEFFFMLRSQVDKMAEELGAIPFDAPGVGLGHRDGKCSFETIIEHFGLADRALLRLAEIVHGADVAVDREKAPLAAGLEAIAPQPTDSKSLRLEDYPTAQYVGSE